VKRGWVPVNPVDQVDKPRQARNREQRILSPPEVEALIRAVPDDALGEVGRPLYLTAAMTGLRIGELLALRWRDVDSVAGRVRVFGTQMAATDAPLRAIQEWMGHADYSTTAGYAHYAPDPSNGAAFVERAFDASELRGRVGRETSVEPKEIDTAR
jgi:integrase